MACRALERYMIDKLSAAESTFKGRSSCLTQLEHMDQSNEGLTSDSSFKEMQLRMGDPEVAGNATEFQRVAKAAADLEGIATAFGKVLQSVYDPNDQFGQHFRAYPREEIRMYQHAHYSGTRYRYSTTIPISLAAQGDGEAAGGLDGLPQGGPERPRDGRVHEGGDPGASGIARRAREQPEAHVAPQGPAR